MSFYLRKSFRAGPVRINVSKSGLGVSAGVKGARVGMGPRGAYVHGGREGLYYRKNLSSGNSRSQLSSESNNTGVIVLVLLGIGFGIWLISWFIQNPTIFITVLVIGVGLLFLNFYLNHHIKKLVTSYKNSLDSAFVTSDILPSTELIEKIRKERKDFPQIEKIENQIEQVERNVYQAVLDKILDDGYITPDEAGLIVLVEQVISLNQVERLRTKKEIFTSAYIEAIEDREITDDELSKLNNLLDGLSIPVSEVQKELDLIGEIMDAQKLVLPLNPIPSEELLSPIQKSETAFYQASAQVLSRRKSKNSSTGHDYSVKRNGVMVITNKRVIVVDDGTTAVRYSDVDDVEVDIDEGLVELSKSGSSRPIIFKVEKPVLVGRYVDLLMNP